MKYFNKFRNDVVVLIDRYGFFKIIKRLKILLNAKVCINTSRYFFNEKRRCLPPTYSVMICIQYDMRNTVNL